MVVATFLIVSSTRTTDKNTTAWSFAYLCCLPPALNTAPDHAIVDFAPSPKQHLSIRDVHPAPQDAAAIREGLPALRLIRVCSLLGFSRWSVVRIDELVEQEPVRKLDFWPDAPVKVQPPISFCGIVMPLFDTQSGID